MRENPPQQAPLGDLIAAAFDGAAHYSADPRVVSRLATRAVAHMLRRVRTARHGPAGDLLADDTLAILTT